MILFRFMSNKEFQKYRCNNKLKNNKVHAGKTNSIGFCFFNTEDFTPEEAMHFLSGVVSFDVCAVFETEKQLHRTYGVYAKPLDVRGDILADMTNLLLGWTEKFTAPEYCCTEYDCKELKLLKYCKDIWSQWDPYTLQKDLKWEEVNNELQTAKRSKTKDGERNKTI